MERIPLLWRARHNMYKTATENDLKAIAERMLAPILEDVRTKLRDIEKDYNLHSRDTARLMNKLVATNERYNKQVNRVIAVRKEILAAFAKNEAGK